jgi:hypothetical protein
MGDKGVCMNTQVLNTEGLLQQLAMHAGIHCEMPTYYDSLVEYNKALCDFDKKNPKNIFHDSIAIDSLSVAKQLLSWRDYLSMCGWNAKTPVNGESSRLETLRKIEDYYDDKGLSTLLSSLLEAISQMNGSIPSVYKNLEIVLPCSKDILPDYILPLLGKLESIGVKVNESEELNTPKVKVIEFLQQWKAEAWLSQQDPEDYDVWINSDNKRLDNWLHMSGKPMAGCSMKDSNPQIIQLFLLSVQLFQRPLNVNTLIQYLLLPECPLNWKLRSKLRKVIISEGGFGGEKVEECITASLEKEFKEDGDKSAPELAPQARKDNYTTYLPFDLGDDKATTALVQDGDVDANSLTTFLKSIRSFASSRAVKILSISPYDARTTQLQCVASLIDALLKQIENSASGSIKFDTLLQWAESIYETGEYSLYNAQVGSQFVIESPYNMVSAAKKTIWCDFFGDQKMPLSTGFLSNKEFDSLISSDIKLWNRDNEIKFATTMMKAPLRLTTDVLTLIVCKRQGATNLPAHPLMQQIKADEIIPGDKLYNSLSQKKVVSIDNHRSTDDERIEFDSKNHSVKMRDTESFSALEDLLQNPFDYFMKYNLKFEDMSATEMKMTLVSGNVAHEAIEYLFNEAKNSGKTVDKDFIAENYEEAFKRALVNKGALLLLPEHHFDKDRLKYRLKSCINNFVGIVTANKLQFVACEQKEEEDLGFVGNVIIQGYMDMLFTDSNGDYVVFDLKYTTSKEKYKKLLEKNRALQLALYKALLNKRDPNKKVRTAYFEMPKGVLYTSDPFVGENVVTVGEKNPNIMDSVRKGYETRVNELTSGEIETADGFPITDIPYGEETGVYPLDSEGVRQPKKVENKYSDYKSFTI